MCIVALSKLERSRAGEDLLRHTRALGLREWQAPDENPRDVSTITNRLSMMWPRNFSRKKHA